MGMLRCGEIRQLVQGHRKGEGYATVLTVTHSAAVGHPRAAGDRAFLNLLKRVHLWGKLGWGGAAGRLPGNLHLGWAPAQPADVWE